jgi:molecular chaperone GrpE
MEEREPAEFQGPAAEEGAQEAPSPQELIEQLRADLELAQAELQAAKERFVRLYADFDNFRKRSAQELEAARQAGRFEAVRALLGTLDDLERALGFAQAKPEDLIPGLRSVLENLERNLARLGLEPVPGVGAEFDPRYHEAIGTVEGEEGRVQEVFQRGFWLGEQLVRPARVVVGRSPSVEPKEE